MSALLVVLDVEFGVDVIGVIVIAPIVTVDVLLILLPTAEIVERCFLLCVLLFEFSSISSILRFVILLSLLPLSTCCCLSKCFS